MDVLGTALSASPRKLSGSLRKINFRTRSDLLDEDGSPTLINSLRLAIRQRQNVALLGSGLSQVGLQCRARSGNISRIRKVVGSDREQCHRARSSRRAQRPEGIPTHTPAAVSLKITLHPLTCFALKSCLSTSSRKANQFHCGCELRRTFWSMASESPQQGQHAQRRTPAAGAMSAARLRSSWRTTISGCPAGHLVDQRRRHPGRPGSGR
jgi:hypothetical protein